jgi:hypothetical protein
MVHDYVSTLFSSDSPPTPISPFKPHDAFFPPVVKLNCSVTMKEGFVVLGIPADRTDEMVRIETQSLAPLYIIAHTTCMLRTPQHYAGTG